jgi:hypothetical protein
LNFQDAEKTYRDLKQQRAAGKLTDADFEAEVAKLRHQDAQGRWWQLGVQTGEWYMHDGQKWNKSNPPVTPASPAAPGPSGPEAGAATEGGAVQKNNGSVLPARRKRVAPAGKGNGKSLPSPRLIGIIAIVAVVAILILVGGYFVISGALGSSATARATTTPTRSLALLPTPVIPTITLAPPTDTPLPPPTIQVTVTEAITPTRAAAKPTATKKPAPPTPAGPTATATANVPPGVYVTNIETIPAKANVGDMIGFKVSFMNTTRSIQTYNWFVKVYQCPEQCQDFKHSYGETLHTSSNVATGTFALSTSQTVNLGAGIRCDLIAIANYVDPVSQSPVPFQATKNNGYFSFTACH